MEAIGLLTYLLSLPGDWVIYKTTLHEQMNCGKDKLDRVFKELQAGSFIVSERVNGPDGKMCHKHTVFDKPPTGEPSPENPPMVNPPLLNTDSNKETITKSSDKSEVLNFENILAFLNEKTGRKFTKINNANKNKFKARIKEGYTKENIKNAIVNACAVQTHRENGYQYLTPEFFTRASTLDKYGTAAAQPHNSQSQLSFTPKIEAHTR